MERELLRTWLAWWAGPARDYGLHSLPIIPPVSVTVELLKCSLCQGIHEDGVCEACGKELHSEGRAGVSERLYTVLRWTGWTLALVVVVGVALVCVPWVVVWCLLFDAD